MRDAFGMRDWSSPLEFAMRIYFVVCCLLWVAKNVFDAVNESFVVGCLFASAVELAAMSREASLKDAFVYTVFVSGGLCCVLWFTVP
jgi:hypothetical protein